MHNLLDLIKKEQNIYNVVFHELIRQVRVLHIYKQSLAQNNNSDYKFLTLTVLMCLIRYGTNDYSHSMIVKPDFNCVLVNELG